jgi:hypothetical protein
LKIHIDAASPPAPTPKKNLVRVGTRELSAVFSMFVDLSSPLFDSKTDSSELILSSIPLTSYGKVRQKHALAYQKIIAMVGFLATLPCSVGLLVSPCGRLYIQRRPRVPEAIEIHAPDEMLNVNRPAVK